MRLDEIERMAPVPPDLDPGWSAATLREILAGTVRRPRRRRAALAGSTAVLLLGGGVAYAGNGVPGWVQSGIDSFAGEQGRGDVDLERIVELTTPDGNRVTVWRGAAEDGSICEVAGDNFTDVGEALGQSYQCRGAGDEALIATWTTASRPFPVGGRVDPATTYTYVYGQLRGAVEAVVTGKGYRRSTTVDPRTGGYHVLLPQEVGGERLDDPRGTVRLYDAAGTLLATVTSEAER